MTGFIVHRHRVTVAAAFAIVGGLAACSGPTMRCTGVICDQTRDIGYLLALASADGVAGGNAVLSEGGSSGGSGRVSFSAGATRVERDQLADNSSNSPTDFATSHSAATSLNINVAVGLTRGAKVGATHVGGLDLLAGATHEQSLGSTASHVGNSITAGSLGIRVGLLGETATNPAVSLSLSHLWVSHLYAGEIDLTMHANRWRLATSKQLGRFGVTSGVGQDLFAGTDLYTLGNMFGGNAFTLPRTNVFVGGSIRFGRVTIGSEVGRLSGGFSPRATNTFGGRAPGRPRTYLTLGVRTAGP